MCTVLSTPTIYSFNESNKLKPNGPKSRHSCCFRKIVLVKYLLRISSLAYTSHNARHSHFSKKYWCSDLCSSPPPLIRHFSMQNAASDISWVTTYRRRSTRILSSPSNSSSMIRSIVMLNASMTLGRSSFVRSVSRNLPEASSCSKRTTQSPSASSSIPSVWKNDMRNLVRKAGMGSRFGSPRSKSHILLSLRNMLWSPPSVRPQVHMRLVALGCSIDRLSSSKDCHWSMPMTNIG
mmetsp:Transcript_25496/g.41457  ORF Transcript_25496/g.41457 Transcript_25496/m.41457 type:complete len:236 (+) Transcript_25496:69-776(+)